MAIRHYFSNSYAEAREKFIAEANARRMATATKPLPEHTGPKGEHLSMDVAFHAPDRARSVLVLTSGVHGPEGFCGSGCQIGLLKDDAFFKTLADHQCALLLVHAVNPFGFAHLRRTNESNIDLNRNVVDFEAATNLNPGYAELDPLLLPQSWPPTAADNAALDAYIAKHGDAAFNKTLSSGQYQVADGAFYGGRATSWSIQQLREVLVEHAKPYSRLSLVDIHTGLGPFGHGEKIFVNQDENELCRAYEWWGPDVKPMFEPGCISTETRGSALFVAYDLPGQVETTTLGLEFGTYEHRHVSHALRADHWLHRHPEAPAVQAAEIKQRVKDAFYPDVDEWKGAVFSQARVIALQAIAGLAGR